MLREALIPAQICNGREVAVGGGRGIWSWVIVELAVVGWPWGCRDWSWGWYLASVLSISLTHRVIFAFGCDMMAGRVPAACSRYW